MYVCLIQRKWQHDFINCMSVLESSFSYQRKKSLLQFFEDLGWLAAQLDTPVQQANLQLWAGTGASVLHLPELPSEPSHWWNNTQSPALAQQRKNIRKNIRPHWWECWNAQTVYMHVHGGDWFNKTNQSLIISQWTVWFQFHIERKTKTSINPAQRLNYCGLISELSSIHLSRLVESVLSLARFQSISFWSCKIRNKVLEAAIESQKKEQRSNRERWFAIVQH